MEVIKRRPLFLFLFLISSFHSSASTLGQFEEKILERKTTEKKEEEKKSTKAQHSSEPLVESSNQGSFLNLAGDSLFYLTTRVLFYGALYGGTLSLERMFKGSEAKLKPRKSGEVMLPKLAMDVSYQQINSETFAYNGRLEFGYGPFAVEAQETSYKEREAENHLQIIQIHGLYRMSFSEKSGLSLGFGSLLWNGRSRKSGFSFMMPLQVHLAKNIELKCSPAWAFLDKRVINDYKLALAYSQKYVSAQGGYRWFGSGHEYLQGPYGGLVFHY